MKAARKTEVVLFCCLMAAVVGLLTVNILLRQKNRQLSLQSSSLAEAEGPTIGSRITALHGQTITHTDIAISTSNSNKTLLLVFSPTCPYCKINLPTWRKILREYASLNVIYVDISGNVSNSYLTAEELDQNHPLFTLSTEEKLQYDLRSTPTTVLLDPAGTVIGKWIGVMTPANIDELQTLMKS